MKNFVAFIKDLNSSRAVLFEHISLTTFKDSFPAEQTETLAYSIGILKLRLH